MTKISGTVQEGSTNILLVEDHHEAYYVWRERLFKKIILVHMDAHIDFGFQEVKDLPFILHEARTLTELRSQLEKAILFRRKQFDIEKLTHIGNYIYPAMRDGIVTEFYWVIPGDIGEFRKCQALIKRLLRDLRKEDPCPPDLPQLIRPGFIQTRLYGKPLYISVLEALPQITDSVLLDIDIDFFVIDSLRRSESTEQIARREPWIDIDDFIRELQGKIPDRLFTTIAYSANGGFTPMIWKTLGDLLAKGLSARDHELENRLTAGEHFRRFRDAFDKNDFEAAGNHYRTASQLNATYRVPDNNYGPLYFQSGDYRRAQKEWQGMLRVDDKDHNALCGLGKIQLARRKYREAKSCFAAALRLKSDHRESLIGLAQAEFHLKNYGDAKSLISTYERSEPMQDYSRYLIGRLYEKMRRPQEALVKYKEALQLGMDHVDLLSRLVRLSKRYEKANLVFLRKRCEAYRQSHLRKEKRLLLKKGKTAEAKKLEGRFRKLLASLNQPS